MSRFILIASLFVALAATTAQAQLFCWKMPEPDGTFQFETTGGNVQRLITVQFVLPPKAAIETLRPAIVLLHGVEGPKHGRMLHLLQARRLAAEGYAVFIVNYFDGLGYTDLLLYRDGKLDVAAIQATGVRDSADWLAATTEALGHIARQPGVDPTRIGVLGYSLGCFVGLTTVQLAAEQEAIPDAAAFVGNWGAMPEQAKFSNAFPPALLFHGECDEVVPVAAARATAAALVTAGVRDVRLKVFAGEPHMIVRGSAADDAYQTTLTFLAERLGK